MEYGASWRISVRLDAELALLMQDAREQLHAGQAELDLGWKPGTANHRARVVASRCQVLWQVLTGAYVRLGFEALADGAFAALVLARIIEPTSKADTVRVLAEIDVKPPHVNTLHTALKSSQERDRGILSRACVAHSARKSGTAALIMSDVTVRHEALVVRVGVRGHYRGAWRSACREAGGSLTGETSGRAGSSPDIAVAC